MAIIATHPPTALVDITTYSETGCGSDQTVFAVTEGKGVLRSVDGGRSWQAHYILRDDGPDGDLGYPSSVELGDGSILTVYYQKVSSTEEKCSLMWTRWELPT